ncbi:hypothetical protein ZWY2020_031251 [Hordeum vulgare]|nr:hypothetical protein ZWY2020_031251 [Hordeum vulgare]
MLDGGPRSCSGWNPYESLWSSIAEIRLAESYAVSDSSPGATRPAGTGPTTSAAGDVVTYATPQDPCRMASIH